MPLLEVDIGDRSLGETLEPCDPCVRGLLGCCMVRRGLLLRFIPGDRPTGLSDLSHDFIRFWL